MTTPTIHQPNPAWSDEPENPLLRATYTCPAHYTAQDDEVCEDPFCVRCRVLRNFHEELARYRADLRYTRAVAVWIAQRIDANPHRVRQIEFEHVDGQAISDLTWDSGMSVLSYRVMNQPQPGQKKRVSVGKDGRIDLAYISPAQLIREVLAILDNPAMQEYLPPAEPTCTTCGKPVGDVLTSSTHDGCLS